jgi:UTP--glucose-1-phosphate uridylyltransferase
VHKPSNQISHVKKAVIPAAGLGTRLGALSAMTPKELLPLVNKPSLQWILEEAREAGLTEICLIISPAKSDLIEKFLGSYPTDLKIQLVMQRRPGGLGHAILAAERWVGDDPFVVILPDDYLLGENSISRLIESHKKTGLSSLALSPASQMKLSQYGVAVVKPKVNDILHVLGIVEKPKLGSAPSNLSVVGRYLLTHDIWEPLHQEALNSSGEIQLTNALQSLTQEALLVAVEMNGERHDIGNQTGWLEANVAFSKWIEDGSSVLAPNNHAQFSKILAEGMELAAHENDAQNTTNIVIAKKELIDQERGCKCAFTRKVPFISTKMWDTASMELVHIENIDLMNYHGENLSLREQWNRFKADPNSASPYVILFQDGETITVVDGMARIDEMRKIGMCQIPAWVVKNSNLKLIENVYEE